MNIQDLHIAPFPFQNIGSVYQFSARWEDIQTVLEQNLQDCDIRLAGTVFKFLNVLWDGEPPFVNLEDIDGESIWMVYWNSPYFHKGVA